MILAKDVKAVENPISAMFDLADDVYDEIPKLKKMVRYAIIFIGIWWVIDLAFTVAFFVLQFFVGVALLVLLVIGLFALRLLFTAKDFLIYYDQRHRAIKSVRNASPEVQIPAGKTPAERILNYLKEKNSGVRAAMRKGAVQTGAPVRLKAGEYTMDCYAMISSPSSWRWFDIGEMGFAFYLKYFDNAPSLEEIRKFESAIIENTKRTGTPPGRAIILMSATAEGKLSDDVYDYVTKNVIMTKYTFSSYYCTIQLVTEGTDKTYDFIPFVADN